MMIKCVCGIKRKGILNETIKNAREINHMKTKCKIEKIRLKKNVNEMFLLFASFPVCKTVISISGNSPF